MSSRRSFSLGKALSAAVASVPALWGGAWLSLLLLWAALAAWPLAFARLSCCLALAGGIVVLWLLKVIALGGLYRTSVFGRTAAAEGRGPGGAQFGAPEARLLLASVLIFLFMAVIAIAAIVIFAIAFDFSGLARGYGNSFAGWHAALMRHRSAADWTFTGLPVLMAVFFIFLGVKLVLAPVATIAEKRVVSLNAMGLSAGNAGKLFIGLVALALPFGLLAAVVMHHMPYAGPMMGDEHVHLLPQAGLAAVAVMVLLPLQTGFLTSAYRQIVDLRTK
jgi:hypothetical protein